MNRTFKRGEKHSSKDEKEEICASEMKNEEERGDEKLAW
jgi:hypothetical protein